MLIDDREMGNGNVHTNPDKLNVGSNSAFAAVTKKYRDQGKVHGKLASSSTTYLTLE